MKHNTKRAISAVLAAIMIMSVCPVTTMGNTNTDESAEERVSGILNGRKNAPANTTDSDETVKQGYVTNIESDTQIQLARGATKDTGDDNYTWTPLNEAADHRFTYRINFHTSGVEDLTNVVHKNENGDIVPGDFQIRIPKRIIKNRSGLYDDYIDLGIPTYEEAAAQDSSFLTENNIKYVYYEDGDDYVMTNIITIPAATNGYIEVAYITKDQTFVYKDNTKFTLDAEITVTGQNGKLTTTLQSPTAVIDTTASIRSVYKSAPGIATRAWDTSWGTAPSDADNYIYLRWTVRSYITDDPTQPYDFTLKDTDLKVTAVGTDGKTTALTTPEVILINIGNGWQKPTDGTVTKTSLTADAYRYDYVITRMPKDEYNACGSYTVTNTAETTVKPSDKIDDATTVKSTAYFTWEQPHFVHPTGHFYSYKFGDYNSYTYPYRSYHADHPYSWYSLDQFEWEGEQPSSGAVDTAGSDNYFYYDVWGYGYPYPWTLQDGADYNDPNNYGKVPVTWTITDDALYLEQGVNEQSDSPVIPTDAKTLTTDDYTITELPVQINGQGASYDPDSLDSKGNFNTYTFGTDEHPFSSTDVVDIYAKYGSRESSYVKVGSYNLGTGAVTVDDTDHATIETTSTHKWNNETISTKFNVKFKTADVVGYKVSIENAWYYCSIHAYPHVTLKHSDNVVSLMKDSSGEWKNRILLANVSDFTVSKTATDGTVNTIFEMPRATLDRAVCPKYSASLRKHVISTGASKLYKTYTIRWEINQKEEVSEGAGETGYVTQNGGIFYDLLPEGSDFDQESLVVKTVSGTKLSDDMYSYSVTQNWNGSGRSLLVVSIKEPAEAYTVWYNTIHSWDSIRDYGSDVLNPVAYETGNDTMHGGWFDNGGKAVTNDNYTQNDHDALSDKNTDIMKGLDTSYTGDMPKFLFAEQTHNIDTTTWSVSGLKKQVKSSDDKVFSYSTTTTPSGYYAYNIRFENTALTKSKDIILYDNLEQYSSAKENVDGSDWYGTLVGINISHPISLGAAPVVYISTSPVADMDTMPKLSDTSVWTKVTDTADQSVINTAKAIAIDLSKTSAGNDFVLGEGKSVVVQLYMKAPDHGIKTPDNTYAYAYNNIYASDNTAQADTENWTTTPFYIHQDYTKINLVVKGNISLHKVSEKDSTKNVEGASFTLSGTSDYGTAVNETATTSENGNIVFKNIEMGTYTLTETGTTDDWFTDGMTHTAVIDENGNATIDGKPAENSDESRAVLTDPPRIHADLEFQKERSSIVSSSTDTSPYGKADAAAYSTEGTEFKLYGTSDYGNKVLLYGTADSTGKVTIKGIEKGSYTMKETKAANGFDINTATWTVVVDENGLTGISDASGKPVDMKKNGQNVIYDVPLWKFSIWKDSSYDNNAVAGTTFHLTGTGNTGKAVDETVTTGTNGEAAFTNIPSGTYVLQESKAADGYVTDSTQRTVTITKEGIVKLSGITSKDDNTLHIVNQKVPDKQVVVVKKWVNDSASERTIPVIHISGNKPEKPDKTATFDKSKLRGRIPSATATSFQKGDVTKTLDEIKAITGAAEVDDGTTNREIWLYPDGTDYYWWSNAQKVYLPAESNSMFVNDSSMARISMNGIDSSKVTDMSSMFSGCTALNSLDIQSFDSKNVVDMKNMFKDCTSLISLDITGLSAAKPLNISSMFEGCTGLKSLDVSKLDTSSTTNMSSLFKGCTGLTSLDITGITTPKAENMSSMFEGCTGLESIDVSSLDASGVTNISSLFKNCTGLTGIDISGLTTSKAVNMSSMFEGCTRLESIDVSKLDTSSATNISSLFKNCTGLTSLDVSSLTTSKAVNMSSMFEGCTGLTSLNVSGLDTSNTLYMNSLFMNCKGLTSIDISGFATSKATNMDSMFAGCIKITTIYASDKWSTDKVSSSTNMLRECISIKGSNGTLYTAYHIDKTYARIDTVDTPGYFTKKTA